VSEVMSVQWLGKLMKWLHGAKERRARVKEDGADSRARESSRMPGSQAYRVCQCDLVAGGCQVDSARRWRRFVSVVVPSAKRLWDFATNTSSTLLGSILHGGHYVQRVERYQSVRT